MALNINNIRSLFFDAANNEIAVIDNALLQAFIAACDPNVGHDDEQILNDAQGMLDPHGVLAVNIDPIPGLINLTQHPITTGDVLAVIASRTNAPAVLNAIVNHANHNAASDTAVIDNINTEEAGLVILAGRAVLAADLGKIVNHAGATAASDTAVINNVNTLAADLVTIAGRTVLAADLNAIVNHANHNAASDTAVIDNIHTEEAGLVILAGRTVLAGDLHNIVIHRNANRESDLAVINNIYTEGADLVTIANRIDLPEALARIVNHINRNAVSDTAVINNGHTAAADLATIAVRTGSPADLHAIVNHVNRDAASDAAVINNPNTAPDSLERIAESTLDVANLSKIARHAHGNFAQILNAIIQNVDIDNANREESDTIVLALDKTELDAGRPPRLNAASLAAIAARTKSINQLNYIANHPNANNAAVLNAIVRNEAVGLANRAESDRKVSELEQAWLANPVNAPRLVVESVLEIAKRATHVEALRQIAAYPVTNIDILREVIRKRNADDAEVIHGIVARNQDLIDIGHAELLEVADLMNLIKFRNVLAADLILIAELQVSNLQVLQGVINHVNNDKSLALINAILDVNDDLLNAVPAQPGLTMADLSTLAGYRAADNAALVRIRALGDASVHQVIDERAQRDAIINAHPLIAPNWEATKAIVDVRNGRKGVVASAADAEYINNIGCAEEVMQSINDANSAAHITKVSPAARLISRRMLGY